MADRFPPMTGIQESPIGKQIFFNQTYVSVFHSLLGNSLLEMEIESRFQDLSSVT
jgi:hypothetical protein